MSSLITSHSATGQPPKALINGDTVVASSDQPSKSDEQIQAEAAGFAVTVVNGATWGGMTEAQFRAYDVLIIGDPFCNNIAPSVMANLTTWTDAVMHSGGNRIVVGSDPVVHSSADSTHHRNHIILDGITFAGAVPGATGAYVTTSCDNTSRTVLILNELSQSGTGWSVTSPTCAGNIGIVGSHPLITHTTNADLSNWSCSSHSAYPTWANDWVPFAISADAPTKNTCANDVETGKEVCGEPYILFSGSGTSISSKLTLSPSTSTNPAGTDHTLTATIDNPTLAGITVSFSISSGPNAGKTGSCVTDASGKCTFTYHDDGGVGTDTIVAEFTDDGGHVQQATASKTWEASGATVCSLADDALQPDQPLELNHVVQGNVVKTLAMEKEVFACGSDRNDDGAPDSNDISLVRDVETFIEIVENRTLPLKKGGNSGVKTVELGIQVATCTKDFDNGRVSCAMSPYDRSIPFNAGPAGPGVDLRGCRPHTNSALQPSDPVEMGTVFLDNTLAKTAKVEKEVLDCRGKVVDMYLFTEIFERTASLFSKKGKATTIRPFHSTFLGVLCVKKNPRDALGGVDTSDCYRFTPAAT
jgi:hypothetical protein